MEQDDVQASEAAMIEWSEQREGRDLEIELIIEDQRWNEISKDFSFLKECIVYEVGITKILKVTYE